MKELFTEMACSDYHFEASGVWRAPLQCEGKGMREGEVIRGSGGKGRVRREFFLALAITAMCVSHNFSNKREHCKGNAKRPFNTSA